jgi:hypothetical protein
VSRETAVFPDLPPVIVAALIILVRLPYHRANSSAGSAPDNRSLQTAAEDCAQSRSACRANQRAFARPNPTSIRRVVPRIVAVVIMIAVIMILAAMPAITHSVIETATLRIRGNCARYE